MPVDSGQFQKDLTAIRALVPERYQDVGGGMFVDPSTGSQYIVERAPATGSGGYEYDEATGQMVPVASSGGFKLRKLTDTEMKRAAGTTGASAARLASDDPRYWQLQYDQLAAEYTNMGLDAESARRQALASLIQSRNAGQVDLAQASGNIAAKAAEFAANPRDAVTELMYRNAIGGGTPFGETQNPAFGQYGAGLQDKFQELFGGVGGDLARAREFLSSPPPAEFLSPSGAPNVPAAPMGGGGAIGAAGAGLGEPAGGGVPAPALPSVPLPPDWANGNTIERTRDAQRPGISLPDVGSGGNKNGLQQLMDQLNSFSPDKKQDFRKWVTAANGGVAPPTAEDGSNMNIMEPFMVVGHSGKIYATGSESDPEQLRIVPLPSVMERKKKEKESAQQFKKATQGAMRNATGGTINVMPDTTQFYDQLRQTLSGLGGSEGGAKIGPGQQLPSLRQLAGAPFQQLEQDPDLLDYTLAGYSAQGISPRSALATIKKFTPQAPQGNLPRVVF